MLVIIGKILLVAITVAFLGAWGIIKQQRKPQELISKLYKKAEERLLNSLNKKDKLSFKDIEKIVKGTKASLFWSKEKVQVTDPKIVAKELVENMKAKGLIIEEIKNGHKTYSLK